MSTIDTTELTALIAAIPESVRAASLETFLVRLMWGHTTADEDRALRDIREAGHHLRLQRLGITGPLVHYGRLDELA